MLAIRAEKPLWNVEGLRKTARRLARKKPQIVRRPLARPTRAQLYAARMLLEWSGDDLAKAAGVSLITVRRAESADADQRALAYRAIVRALEDAGIPAGEMRGRAHG